MALKSKIQSIEKRVINPHKNQVINPLIFDKGETVVIYEVFGNKRLTREEYQEFLKTYEGKIIPIQFI